jgi:hypothetical protein
VEGASVVEGSGIGRDQGEKERERRREEEGIDRLLRRASSEGLKMG